MRVLLSIILAAAVLIGCSEESITQSQLSDQQSVFTPKIEALTMAKKGDKVSICHFPPDNPTNHQILSVSAKAAANHIDSHEGDGVVGIDYDEDCKPLATPCPCWSDTNLQEYSWRYLGVENKAGSTFYFMDDGWDERISAHLSFYGSGTFDCKFYGGEGTTFELISETEANQCLADMTAAAGPPK